MSGVLEKFGIYDFMGIWGPGAITVTYYMFTLHQPIENALDKLGIINLNISQVNLLIILYTAVAYVLGVILHETGKLLAGLIPCFYPPIVKELADYTGQPTRYGSGVKGEYVNAIESVIPQKAYKEMNFEEAISNLKFNNNISTKRIDTYHSVYALARSLTLCFCIHCGIELILWLSSEMSNKSAEIIMFIDFIMAILFFDRTYRYYYSWIRNIFVQYFLSIPANERKKRYESDQITATCVRYGKVRRRHNFRNLRKYASGRKKVAVRVINRSK